MQHKCKKVIRQAKKNLKDLLIYTSRQATIYFKYIHFSGKLMENGIKVTTTKYIKEWTMMRKNQHGFGKGK